MSQRHEKLPDEVAKDEERRQYATGGQTLQELDAKYVVILSHNHIDTPVTS